MDGNADVKGWDSEARLGRHVEEWERCNIIKLHPYHAEKRIDSHSCLETYANQSKFWRKDGKEDIILTTSGQAENAAHNRGYVQIVATWVDKDPEFMKIEHSHVNTAHGRGGASSLKVPPGGFPKYGTHATPKELRELCVKWMEKGVEVEGVTYSPGCEWTRSDPVYASHTQQIKNRTSLVRGQYIALRVTDGGLPRTDYFEAHGTALTALTKATCTAYSSIHKIKDVAEHVCKHIAKNYPSDRPVGGH